MSDVGSTAVLVFASEATREFGVIASGILRVTSAGEWRGVAPIDVALAVGIAPPDASATRILVVATPEGERAFRVGDRLAVREIATDHICPLPRELSANVRQRGVDGLVLSDGKPLVLIALATLGQSPTPQENR